MIHFQLWRSFQQYDARGSLRTWIYRVAHHEIDELSEVGRENI
jgi:DNA-directed RNA polymerase specialized sigma24 family protein